MICIFVLVPIPSVTLALPETQLVGQSLTLECSVTTVRGITSRVDVVWRRNSLRLVRRRGISVNSTSKDMLVFTDLYTITQLSTSNNGTTYQCEVVIRTSRVITTSSNLAILDVIGTCIV